MKINKKLIAVVSAIVCAGVFAVIVGAEVFEPQPAPPEAEKQLSELNASINKYALENGLDLSAASYAYDIPVQTEAPDYSDQEITFTPLESEIDGMTDEEKDAYFISAMESIGETDGFYPVSMRLRSGSPPTQLYNLSVSDYNGSGTFTNNYIYTNYYYLCGSNYTLIMNGWCGVPRKTSQNLVITLKQVDGGSVACPVAPTFYTSEGYTIYYYNFAVGPLNPNAFYYFMWTPVDAISQHTISFTVSN